MVDQSLALTQEQEQRQIQLLAPQLRQSLELLQAPMLELRDLVQQELQINPTLEEKPPKTVSIEVEPGGSEVDDAKELAFTKEFEILSRIDEEGYRYFMQDLSAEADDPGRAKRRTFFIDSRVKPESLQEHLEQQLRVAGLGEQDLRIGELIIGSINDDGYLLQNLEEMAAATGFAAAHIHDVLVVIQDFDPVGVGARDVRECLLLQLERLGQADSLPGIIVKDHLEALGNKQFKEIAQALAVPLEQVQLSAKVIATLEPKPGRAFSTETPTYIIPDVVVEKTDAGYVIHLNDEYVPRLWINRQYRDMMRNDSTKPDVKAYIKERIQAGLFLIKSITQRQRTLYRVASEIVRVQSDFLDKGLAQLKALNMTDVARAVGLHETTICRCVANKYIKTPRGLFEMKYFFTPGFRTADGQAVSFRAVLDKLAALVAAEDPKHPLSDHEIVECFKREGWHSKSCKACSIRGRIGGIRSLTTSQTVSASTPT
ncbi:MAG: RNA polymerase factor sigma-54 [Lentisphaerae bacterium]|nr:RNA polymerase factor sigma-54 [Lentisphaerota bacterium]